MHDFTKFTAMMTPKKTSLLLLFLLVCAFSFAQTIDMHLLRSPDQVAVGRMQQTPDGGWIGNMGPNLVKLDAQNNVEWVQTNSFSGVFAICQTSDGGYLGAATASNTSHGQTGIYVQKSDAMGNVLWGRTFGGADQDDVMDAIGTDDGGAILTGMTRNSTHGFEDIYIMRLDSLGNPVWTFKLGDTGQDVSNRIRKTSDGNYIILGQKQVQSNPHAILIKFDPSGTILWSQVFGSTGFALRPITLTPTLDGGYLISALHNNNGSFFFGAWIAKTDSTGTLEWQKVYSEANAAIFSREAVEIPGKGFLLSGISDGYVDTSACMTPPCPDIVTFYLDTAGTTIWTKGNGTPHNEYVRGLKVLPGNKIQVIGGQEDSDGPADLTGMTVSVMELNGNMPCGSKDISPTESSPTVSVSTGIGVLPTPFDMDSVTVTSSAGSLTDSVYCSAPVSREEPMESSGFSIYPNPGTQPLNVDYGDLRVERLRVLDATGRIVREWGIDGLGEVRVNVGDLTPGVYFVELQVPGRGNLTKQWVKLR